MPALKGLEWTFDTVAATYERLRPGYPEALYRAILDYIPVNENSRVVEVGSGGGQATEPMLATGCELTAVECGAQFSALLREKFGQYPRFSVITGKFEQTAFEESAYHLVFSASAFHWVPEEMGYPQVYAMLRSGGAFARFANHPYRDKGNAALCAQIDALYAKYYYPFHGKEPTVPQEYTVQQACERAKIAEKYGFADIRYEMFYRKRHFTAQQYVALLGTYSDHIVLPEHIRTRFFAEIEQAITQSGTGYTVYDTIDLQLARKA